MNNTARIAAIAGLLLVGALVFAAGWRGGDFGAVRSVNERESYWKDRIASLGPKDAYRELGASVAEATPEVQHAEAHAFGSALYLVEGKKGLSTCDANFNFGCYHEFLGSAIAEEGLGVVQSLNQGCFDALSESPLSCQHGIGHGVLAYEGYGEDALLKGLAECARVPYADPIGGCYGGLFMEYNLQTMLATEARLRPLGTNPLEPCDALEEEYRTACYYWQPQWWAQVVRPGLVGEPAFRQMGEWCAMARGHEKDCYEGIGNIASPESNFMPKEARRLCEAVSDDWRAQLYCKSIAANSLSLGGGGKKVDGITVCEGLTGEARTYCAAYSRNESNIVNRGALEGE